MRAALLAESDGSGADFEDTGLGFDPILSWFSFLKDRFQEYNNTVGSSERVCSLSLLKDPPSLAAGEITDKAYVNQRAVLKYRSEQVERLYWNEPNRDVIRV